MLTAKVILTTFDREALGFVEFTIFIEDSAVSPHTWLDHLLFGQWFPIGLIWCDALPGDGGLDSRTPTKFANLWR